MALLGIDYGLKKVGIAFSQGDIASPLAVWKVARLTELVDKTVVFCSENNIDRIIIGMPEKSKNSEALISEIHEFSDILKTRLHVPVEFEPEVFTTKTARSHLLEAHKKKSRRSIDDDFAAAVILQSYIDRTNQ